MATDRGWRAPLTALGPALALGGVVIAIAVGCISISHGTPMDLCAFTSSYPVVVQARVSSVEPADLFLQSKSNTGNPLSAVTLEDVRWIRESAEVMESGASTVKIAMGQPVDRARAALSPTNAVEGEPFFFWIRRDRELVGTCDSCVFWKHAGTGRFHNNSLYATDGVTVEELETAMAAEGRAQVCPPPTPIDPNPDAGGGVVDAPDGGRRSHSDPLDP